MAHALFGRESPDQHSARPDRRPASHEARLALRLVASGLVIAVLSIVLTAAGLQASVGPVSVLGMMAIIGLLTVVAGGVFAITAIFRRGERSVLVLATLPVSVFALLVLLAQIIFHVP